MSALARNRWWITRLLVLPLHLLVFSVVAFFLVRMVPGDPVQNFLKDGNPTAEDYARVEQLLGLDGSLWEQFLRYLGNVVVLDFGTSISSGRPVFDELMVRFPITLQLTLIGMIVTIAVGFAGSYVAAVFPRSAAGRAIRAYARAAGAIPDFVLGVLSIFLFYVLLRWAPAPIGLVGATETLPPAITGMSLIDALLVGDVQTAGSILAHLALPVLVLALGYSPLIMKILIISLDEALDAAPTRFRIATGSRPRVVLASVFRRAAPSAIVVCGMLFGGLLGGSVVLDQLFSLGGIGQYAVASINSSDIPVLQGFLLLTAGISLLVYLLVDVVNMLLDPRRRPGLEAAA
ncbi:ABC transporter permease [Microbacterium excoecariae]|uniref:ABC transporter permease n=1 Tax=Microbacterium excoecariae TaxID=2715210 RepID=UPI00140B6CAA|nr:ABC transporter permease [Microbacterium excoecariae]NHI17690.1 ABC transporter permease [Microbacterium excoecariae]